MAKKPNKYISGRKTYVLASVHNDVINQMLYVNEHEAFIDQQELNAPLDKAKRY